MDSSHGGNWVDGVILESTGPDVEAASRPGRHELLCNLHNGLQGSTKRYTVPTTCPSRFRSSATGAGSTMAR